MNFKSLIGIFITIQLLFTAYIYSQANFNNLDSNKISNNEKVKLKFIFSFKTGYHTDYEIKKENGFNDGLIFSGNLEIGLTETFFAGINYEFWHHKSGELKSYFGKYTTVYTANNFNINLTKRFLNENYSINIGIGMGKYNIGDSDGNKESYINFKLLTGFDIRIYKMLWISTEINYNIMANMEKEARLASFKIGPTIMLDVWK